MNIIQKPGPKPLHLVTECMLRGLNAACEQVDEEIAAAETEAEVWALHQWLKAIAARMASLVDASGAKLNAFGARTGKVH